MDLIKFKNILQTAEIIVKNEKVEKELKGEYFNVFSILNMETKENSTHSAFLGELLNPHGSHLMGNTFLKLFLELLEEDIKIDINSASVVLEKYIGPIIINENDPLKSSGGRIDIYIDDDKGNTISIENKINAPEQKLQVVRYWNHRKDKNKVYYLTKTGETPTEFSAASLESGKDFQEIHYSDHILHWLSMCQKEAFERPILRESIKQYSHLLKKITGKMDISHQKELHNIILSNFEAAEIIVHNFNIARESLCKEIQQSVFESLTKKFKDLPEIIIELGSDVVNKHSQIWLRRNDQDDKKRVLNFVLESFSGRGNNDGQLFLAILNPNQDSPFGGLPNKLTLSNWMINEKKISPYKGIRAHLGDKSTIQKLYTEKDFKGEFIEYLVHETREYFDAQYPNLKRFLDENKLPPLLELTDEPS